MREIDEIQADWYLTNSASELLVIAEAEERLIQDIPELVVALAEKDAEIEKLRELCGRVNEADYEMVGANLAHREAIPWECVNGWFYYVHTGQQLTTQTEYMATESELADTWNDREGDEDEVEIDQWGNVA